MITEDLTGLFFSAPGAAPAATLRQGRLLTFNPSNGHNTAQVGSTTLTDVPALLTGAETILAAGDNVLMAQIGNTFVILGKVATPGGAAFASASQATAEKTSVNTNFALPATTFPNPGYTTLCTATLTVPTWANTASIISNFAYSANNTFGADVDMLIRMTTDGEITGNFPDGLSAYSHNGSYGTMSIGQSVKHTVTPGSTLTVLGQGSCTGGFSATADNAAFLNCIAIFTKQ